MRDVDKELELLSSWLRGREGIRSVSILGSPLEPVALLVRRQLPGATLRLVVENARELEAVRGNRDLAGASVEVGSVFGAPTADIAILRISGYDGKERQAERMASARRHLAAEGTLLVLTHTKRGAKSQLAMMEEIFGRADVAERGGGGFRVLAARIRETGAATQAPAAGERPKIREELLGERLELWTDAAVFSKDRVDPGTRLLLETLPPLAPKAVLDFGCGYGVMGIALARRHPGSRVILVDVDAQAVELTRANVALNGVEGNTRAVLSDGLRQIPEERFDLAVIHFPLHIPRDELERLLAEIRDALEPGGCLYGVMLGAYELRPLVRRVFGEVETLRETREGEHESAYSILRACRR
jgi:16S rRNA (guanine1207-N2)-methyltransferase